MKSTMKAPRIYFIMPILICIFFFATAKFYFFNILGVRREVLYLIIGLTLLVSVLKIDYLIKIFKKGNVIMFTLYCIIFVWLIRFNIDTAILFFITTVMIGFIFRFSPKTFDFTFKLIIVCVGIFSFLVLIQAFIYILNPGIFNIPYSAVQPYQDSLEPITINYTIHNLGFWTSGREYLFGIELPRFQSFASEPSILVSIFLIPGLLGLTYKGPIKKISYVVLFFSIILAFAGTIYLSVAVGAIVFFSLFIFRYITNSRRRHLLIFAIIIVYFLAGYFLIKTDVYKMMHLMDIGLGPYSNYSSIIGHEKKLYARTVSNQQAFQLVLANPFGTEMRPLTVTTVTGLLLGYGFLFGYLGVMLCGIVYTIIIIRFVRAFYFKLGLVYKIGISLIIGTIIQTLFFSGYGWLTPSGMIMTSLLYVRSNNLINNSSKQLKFKKTHS